MKENKKTEEETIEVDYKNKWLRAMADADNARKVAAREKEEASKYAISEFATEILKVADALEQALLEISAYMEENKLSAKALDGIKITQKEISATFKRYCIKKMEILGKEFDPYTQVAMLYIPEEKNAGKVVKILQNGYYIQDRVLRAALVAVGKDPEKDSEIKNGEKE